MSGLKIKRDDMVRVIAGKDRGKEGRVVRVLPAERRIMVDGVALAKRHERTGARRSKSGQQLQQGGIIDIETFIDVSNVQLICPNCHQPTRVGWRLDGDEKLRICRKCEADI